MYQRQAFLDNEGDAWFSRNKHHEISGSNRFDPLYPMLCDLPIAKNDPSTTTIAEIGCGQGLRLAQLQQVFGCNVKGIDPSPSAVSSAQKLGIDATIGTAENLPFRDQSIDLLIFGFCLYLCDRIDLFRIASEAHRSLKPVSWIAIIDFWSSFPTSKPYHHRQGLHSFKDDPIPMFQWHPSYIVTDHKVRHHNSGKYTDHKDE